MKPTNFFASIFFCTTLFSCTSKIGEVPKPDTAIVCDTNRTITFSGDIAPFMTSSCGATDVNCHSSSASSMIPLDSYTGVQYYGQVGQLMSSINWTGISNMPKLQPKLSACEIAIVQKWVDEGEPNN
jgi:hypothetical protein